MQELVNVIRNFQFHLLETLWKQFWSQSDSSANGAAAAEVQMYVSLCLGSHLFVP